MFNPVQVIGAQHNGQSAKPRKKEHDPRSIELIYAQTVRNSPSYSRRDGSLFKWTGSHHALVKPGDLAGEPAVLDWLAKFHPDKATPKVARECFKAASMMARPLLSAPTGRVIIPLRNAYLELMDDGSIVRTSPDPTLGMTYVLDVTLAGADGAYTPAPPPAGSLLDGYLTSSLPDAEVRAFLQELAGDTLTPIIKNQIATLLKGSGRNGKSIFMRLLARLHQKTAPMRLDALKGFAMMPLIGASLAIVDEVPKAGLDEQFFKTLVSGEEITIDLKHRDPIRYRPHAKWIISTNNDQKVTDNSDGFWRRLAIIPFDHQIPESEVIPCLDEKIIKDELVHFLDWCLIGLQRLQQRGALPPAPAAVRAAKRDAIEASNSVAAWFAEIAPTPTSEALTPKDKIYGHYADWCERQRLRALSAGQFWKVLKSVFPALGKEQQQRVAGKRVRCFPLSLDGNGPDERDCPF